MDSSETEAEALSKGARLIEQLNGKGWELRVWQNTGWHYEAANGPLTVQATSYMVGPTSYWCLLADDVYRYPGSGAVFWTDTKHPTFEDPNDAVRHQYKIASEFVHRVTRVVDQVAAITPACRGDCAPHYGREEVPDA